MKIETKTAKSFMVTVYYERPDEQVNTVIWNGSEMFQTATAQQAAQAIIDFKANNPEYTITEVFIKDFETYKKYSSTDADIQALNSKDIEVEAEVAEVEKNTDTNAAENSVATEKSPAKFEVGKTYFYIWNEDTGRPHMSRYTVEKRTAKTVVIGGSRSKISYCDWADCEVAKVGYGRYIYAKDLYTVEAVASQIEEDKAWDKMEADANRRCREVEAAKAEREEVMSTPLISEEAMDVAIEAEMANAAIEETDSSENTVDVMPKMTITVKLARNRVASYYEDGKRISMRNLIEDIRHKFYLNMFQVDAILRAALYFGELNIGTDKVQPPRTCDDFWRFFDKRDLDIKEFDREYNAGVYDEDKRIRREIWFGDKAKETATDILSAETVADSIAFNRDHEEAMNALHALNIPTIVKEIIAKLGSDAKVGKYITSTSFRMRGQKNSVPVECIAIGSTDFNRAEKALYMLKDALATLPIEFDHEPVIEVIDIYKNDSVPVWYADETDGSEEDIDETFDANVMPVEIEDIDDELIDEPTIEERKVGDEIVEYHDGKFSGVHSLKYGAMMCILPSGEVTYYTNPLKLNSKEFDFNDVDRWDKADFYDILSERGAVIFDGAEDVTAEPNVDNFDIELAKLKANVNKTQAALIEAQENHEHAVDALGDFLNDAALKLKNKLDAIRFDYPLTLKTVGGSTYRIADFSEIYIGAYHIGCGVEFHFENWKARTIARYDTPAQVEMAINQLKAAIEAGEEEFTFLTIEDLKKPPLDVRRIKCA